MNNSENINPATAIKFNVQDKPEFYREVLKRVNRYFKEKKITKYANLNMKIKTVFMLSLYFIPLLIMLTGIANSLFQVTLMWIIMGFGITGIGLSVMHDANHGSYSKNKTVNSLLGFTLNFVGGFHVNWKIQHNVLHHSFTNIDGHDGDIENPIMRFSPTQKRKKWFKYQAFYAPFLYSLMTIFWCVFKDFQRLIMYNKNNLLAKERPSFIKALLEMIFNKIWYVTLTLVLPLIIIDLPWWQILSGYFLMHFICGLVLALIFQPAHVIEETEFYIPDENNSVENNWAIHQMKTTCNFANGSTYFSWFVGGLNYQIEHHLFPSICHIHYKDISKIVKSTAEEFDVPYHQHKTFYDALKSHFKMLHKLGTGSYDIEKALV